jgi:hypothetical protein
MKFPVAAIIALVGLVAPSFLMPLLGGPITVDVSASETPETRADTTITFPSGGSSDTSFHIQAPRGSIVTRTYLRLEGQAAVPPPQTKKYSFTDTVNNAAFFGEVAGFPPVLPPASYMSGTFTQAAYNDIVTEDGSAVGYTASGTIPYHMFKFKVAEDVITTFTVRWVGTGWDQTYSWTTMDVFAYKSGSWESFGSYSHSGDPSGYSTYSGLCQANADKYVDDQGCMYVLAMGPQGADCIILTDYVDVSVSGSKSSYPAELRMDMANDGTEELAVPGPFNTGKTLMDADLKAPLQALIDAAGPGAGPLDIPFRFTSTAAGKLLVSGADFGFDVAPAFTQVPPDKRHFDEDTTALKLIDLNLYFTDDFDSGKLGYTVTALQTDDRIRSIMDADGHSLGFRSTTRNWFGTREFSVKATDSVGLSVTGFLNITVMPVNDGPVLEKVPAQIAVEDEPYYYAVKATDVEDLPSQLMFTDDSPLFEIGENNGLISFTPTNEQVGVCTIRIDVKDTEGASDSCNFTLTIENANDRPVLDPVADVTIDEGVLWELQLSANDIDAGDVLTYAVESDIGGLRAEPSTGLVQFTFEDAQVGVHEVKLIATDSQGSSAWSIIKMTIVNVEEPPSMMSIGSQKVKQGEELKLQVIATDPDPGDTLTYSTDSKIIKMDQTGLIRFTPSNADVGEHKVKVTVKDAAGATAETSFKVTVENVNDAPTDVRINTPLNNTQIGESTKLHFTGTAGDPDVGEAANLIFTWRDGTTVLGTGRDVEATLTVGTHVIVLEVSDGQLTSSAETTVTVVQQPSPIRGISMSSFLMALAMVIILFVVLLSAAMLVRGHLRRKHLRAVLEIKATPEESPIELITPARLFPPENDVAQDENDDEENEDEDEDIESRRAAHPPSKTAPDDKAPGRGKVRFTIMNSKRVIRKGMDDGFDMGHPERLLLRAAAASYRKEYGAAVQLARKAEKLARDVIDRGLPPSSTSTTRMESHAQKREDALASAEKVIGDIKGLGVDASEAEEHLKAAKKAVADDDTIPERALPVEEGQPSKLKGKRKKGKQIEAKTVREHIDSARQTVDDAKAMGADVTEEEMLLKDAVSSSYSRNYEIADSLARQAEILAAEKLLGLPGINDKK